MLTNLLAEYPLSSLRVPLRVRLRVRLRVPRVRVRVRAAAARLVADGFLLSDDAQRLIGEAERSSVLR